MSAARQSAEGTPDPSGIPGDLHGALEDLNVPAYAVDRFGIIRWINSAAKKLVGDIRGKQQSSVVVPEQAREAKESFLRKMMGTEKSTDATVIVTGPDGERHQVEISSCAIHEGHRIVGVFGVVKHRDKSAPPAPHPHLTPRQNQILHLLAHGHSTSQIAAELHLSIDTVRNHIRRMLRALGAHSRIEALAVAHREGLIRRDE
ncbi:MAG TPA: LuxR C-terminal-related transcriptional regulator [Gaiellaceae bacterium]|nr:LuxR C-terminal-related transcriptional regulator [Gaiellaceae bacterium]